MAEKRERRERRDRDEEREELDERVVDITRVAKVIKGGRRFAFRTVVIVGDNKGRIGIGVGKSRAVPDSIRKGSDRARRRMAKVSLSGSTIPGRNTTFGSGKIGSAARISGAGSRSMSNIGGSSVDAWLGLGERKGPWMLAKVAAARRAQNARS